MGDSHFCYMTKLKRENIDQDIVIKSASQKPTFNKFPTSLPTIVRNNILLTFNKWPICAQNYAISITDLFFDILFATQKWDLNGAK